ncbi:hypothetical protein K469DRAFT_703077 [Zopfia rhizophila CBS 207.26]|uniref:DUF7708 domain-containing protein n=1 Tax=Zopfia rhizophila CBS 207.26 TaxID=1314779 RepID=A0A6A6EBF6_9PEZI|nr:hypothetical protein K469DRAFT_703077 [Zopfia rhizophila CBS 207.26]
MALARRDQLSSLVPSNTSRTRLVGAYTEWYAQSEDSRWIDPARDAYLAAKELFSKELTEDECKRVWIKDKSSMRDVQAAVLQAQAEYERKNKRPKLQIWLARCSSRIIYYGNIMNVLAQHHPEYVALAWGAMKFLFVAVLNHEELLSKTSKAVSRIADVLPRAELHSVLYPTERMKESVAQLYANIIKFIQSAIKWYKKGTLAKSISAVINPYDVAFKDILEEITACSRRVDELANAALKAEIRDQHIQIQRLSELAIANHTRVEQILSSMNDQKQNYTTWQLDSILSLQSSEGLPSQEDSLKYCRSMRRRRRVRTPGSLSVSEMQRIRDWLTAESSSLLIAQAQGIKTSARDFAVDLLDVIIELQIPAIWALPWSTEEDEVISLQDILKSLVVQAINLNPDLCGNGINPISVNNFKRTKTEKEWFAILDKCLKSFARIYVFIDLELIEQASQDSNMESSEFIEGLQQFTQRCSTGIVKIVVLSWKYASIAEGDDEDLDAVFVKTDRGRQRLHLMRDPRYRAAFALRQKNVPNKIKEFLRVNGKERSVGLELG